MNSTSIYAQFWRYTVPTVAAMLVNGLYQVVDGIFIGHYVGGEGLAAINMAWPIIGFIMGAGMMLGVGTGILVSIKQGQGQGGSARHILTSGLTLLLLIAPMLSFILWALAEEFLFWQGANGRVFELGLQYLNIQIYTSVFTLGSIAMPFLLRNDNSPTLATWLMVVGAVLNFALDYLFIKHLGWELQGAAIATGIAQVVVTLLGLIYFFSSRAQLRLSLRDWQFDASFAPKIFSLGASSFFMYVYGSVMVALHNGMLIQYGSQTLVGAYAILGYIIAIYYLVAEGIASGMQPLASYNYGARVYSNIRKLLMVAMAVAVLGGALFVAVLNIYPTQAVGIFNDTDPVLMEGAVTGIRLHLFTLFLDGFLVVAAAYYQSIDQSRKAMFVTIGNMAIQLPFLYLLPLALDITGVWLAYPLSNIALTSIVLVMLWRDLKQMRIRESSQKEISQQEISGQEISRQETDQQTHKHGDAARPEAGTRTENNAAVC